LEIFKASLAGECDPAIAASAIGDVPAHLGREYHRQLSERQHQTPVFFRTDEPVPGKVSEIQCPGSGWCLAEELLVLYRSREDIFGRPRHFSPSLAACFAGVLRRFLGAEPLVHHLVENASRPHGMRYFIQRTREHGVKYFGYDKDVAPQDCNFIRSHDFITLPHHNFFVKRMERCERGLMKFDLPPSVIFDGKIILAWPFWERTREFYSDSIRTLFPFTNVIGVDGFELASGERVSLDALFRNGRGQRNFFIKYAGSDIAINWGSKAVFHAGSLSRAQRGALTERIVKDTQQGRSWIIQDAFEHNERVPVLQRNGETVDYSAHSKFSGFYGPEGLMSILVMQKSAAKVHGSESTVMSVVF
jgi:hypothetical protein